MLISHSRRPRFLFVLVTALTAFALIFGRSYHLNVPFLSYNGGAGVVWGNNPAGGLAGGSAYTAVILYLISTHRLDELFRSLELAQLNLPLSRPWPIILFHTGEYDLEEDRNDFIVQMHSHISVENASLALAGRIEFVKLGWVLPEGIPHDKEALDPVWANAWPGYHHMCAFFTSEIFNHPRLRDVTYYLRLDTDSFIEEALCYDPFELMHVHNRTYGYRSIGTDPPEVTHGFWAFLDRYVRAHPSIEERLVENEWQWPSGRDEGDFDRSHVSGYYNNFEIVKLDAFRSADVASFLDELMSDPERTYKYRWGDSPIRFATVNMFFNVSRDTEVLCGMRYFHQMRPGNQCECIPL